MFGTGLHLGLCLVEQIVTLPISQRPLRKETISKVHWHTRTLLVRGRAVRGAQFGWTRLTAPPPRFLPSSFSSQRAPGQNRGLSWEAWGLARNQMAAGGQVSWGFFRDTAGSSHAAKT